MKNAVSRRGFLRGFGRWWLLGALGGMVGRSVVQGFLGAGVREQATGVSACDRCPLLDSCPQPARAEDGAGCPWVRGSSAPTARNLELVSTSRGTAHPTER